MLSALGVMVACSRFWPADCLLLAAFCCARQTPGTSCIFRRVNGVQRACKKVVVVVPLPRSPPCFILNCVAAWGGSLLERLTRRVPRSRYAQTPSTCALLRPSEFHVLLSACVCMCVCVCVCVCVRVCPLSLLPRVNTDMGRSTSRGIFPRTSSGCGSTPCSRPWGCSAASSGPSTLISASTCSRCVRFRPLLPHASLVVLS